MYKRDFVVFDIETTGLDSVKDEIIEIGLIRISRGEIVEKASWLVNPSVSLPKNISDITGITEEMLLGKPTFEEILPEVERFFIGADIVAHNISFDVGFLSVHFPVGANCLHIDTLDLAKILMPSAINYTLENIAGELGLSIKALHRAGDDAELTANVFLKLYEIASNLAIDALLPITKIFSEESPLKTFFDYALKDKVKNSSVGDSKAFLPSLILNPKPIRDEDEYYKLQKDEVLSWFGAESPLQQDNGDFEVRMPQISMAEAVTDAFNDEKYVVIEAGTGTGKSLAYLLPAAKYALHSGKKVAVATNTISLQEQLLLKDIPQLKKLDLDVRTALIKGRSHYLCLRKLFTSEYLEDLTQEEKLALAKIYCWITMTEAGDKTELNYSPKANNLWRSLANDAESCLGPKCKWYSKNCYFWHARRNAELADILIINHALLLSDCSTDKKILPVFSHLIVDEAHHLDKVASDYLGGECDFTEMSLSLQRLIANQKNEGYSVLGKIRKQLLSLSDHDRLYSARLLEFIDTVFSIQVDIKEQVDNIKDTLKNLLPLFGTENPEYRQVFRIKQSHLNIPLWIDFFERGNNLVTVLTNLGQTLYRFLVELEDFPNELVEKEQWQFEINNYMQYFRDCSHILSAFFVLDAVQEIKWLEYDNNLGNTLVCKCVPYDIGSIIKTRLYDRCETIIFTSATVTVAKKFDYYLGNIGLNHIPERTSTLAVGSTFDYEKQALVVVPSDIGNPQINEYKFLEGTISFLEDIYKNFKGRTLVLFTSHKQLRYVHEKLDLPGDALVLAQNISGSRKKILDSFCKHDNACLLGANTFWEGIDLPGDLLNLLVIVKLPFLPPTHPLLEAKVERVQEVGENAFEKVTLPGAVIRFKQGFGRLIRRSNDKGVVIILDGRVTSKKYGLTFLRSLPIKTFYTATKEDVIPKVLNWLNES